MEHGGLFDDAIVCANNGSSATPITVAAIQESIEQLRRKFPSTKREIFIGLELIRSKLLSVCHVIDKWERPLPIFAIPIEFYATMKEAHASGQQLAKDGWVVRYVEMPSPEELGEGNG